MKAKLYAMPASHPSMAAALMLERKRVDYRTVWLLLPFTGPILRVRGFPRRTVPALRIDGRKIQGSRAISSALDDLKSEPALFPRDQNTRRQVEEAERWGDEVLQPAARRIEIWELRRDRGMVATQLADSRRIQGARVPIKPRLAAATSGPTIAWYARLIGASDDAVRSDLRALPAMLERIDEGVSGGVLGGNEPNAADFQIAPSLALLMTVEELRPHIEGRPAGRLASRLVPEYPGHTGGILPPDWLPNWD
ncbi:MAG TPA: glutathione S-transferase N-terminal domain-containing protein [Solirubrobacterales bacterium]|jgi:glutathione S-transferase